jgi:hypothetical protein
MATPFTFETADDGGQGPVHGELSLALDKTGNPRVAYAQQVSGQIMVARRDGGAWTRESVPGGAVGSGVRICLAIDSQGNPQLAYRDQASGELIHAVKSADQWTFTHVATRLTDHKPGGVGTIAFALHPGRHDPESRDVPFFVYADPATDGIGFAHSGIGPSPVVVQLDPTLLTTFGQPSAAFDPSEGFFIAYVGFFHDGSPVDFVSVRATLVTDIEQGTLAPPAVIEGSKLINVRSPTSIVRTAFEGCISYFDRANKTLKAQVASPELPEPRIEIVATSVNNVTATPSAAASRGQFRVAYADDTAIKLASRGPSGDWTVEVVDPVSGLLPSLAYDNSGTANLAYAVGGQLKYARRSE